VSKTKNFLPAFSDTKIRQTLKAADGHVKKAAAVLGVGFSSFYARLKTMREAGSPIMTAAAAALAKKKPARKKAAASVAVERKAAVKKRKTAIKKAPVKKKTAPASAKKTPARRKATTKKKR
jgi:hypothetical protein